MIAAAIAGAALGSKILFWLEDPQLTLQNLGNPVYLMGGKTIVGALVFGLIAVELMKRYIGVRQSTGDLYAIPLALGIAIGRIGCFLTGLSDNTYGTPTALPWAINFGDGIPRHPTQLYEIIFLLALIPLLYKIVIPSGAEVSRSETSAQSKDPSHDDSTNGPARSSHDPFLPGDAFKFFMVAYLSFRLLCDFIKPYPRIFLGLGGIQWACLLTLLYYSRDIVRWSAMKIIATIALGFVALIASLACLLSSICAVSGGWSGSGRAGFAFTALFFLGIAIAPVMLVGELNKKT